METPLTAVAPEDTPFNIVSFIVSEFLQVIWYELKSDEVLGCALKGLDEADCLRFRKFDKRKLDVGSLLILVRAWQNHFWRDITCSVSRDSFRGIVL